MKLGPLKSLMASVYILRFRKTVIGMHRLETWFVFIHQSLQARGPGRSFGGGSDAAQAYSHEIQEIQPNEAVTVLALSARAPGLQ